MWQIEKEATYKTAAEPRDVVLGVVNNDIGVGGGGFAQVPVVLALQVQHDVAEAAV